jgi:hypothetical protein
LPAKTHNKRKYLQQAIRPKKGSVIWKLHKLPQKEAEVIQQECLLYYCKLSKLGV